MNFLQETKEILRNHELTLKDIKFVQTEKGSISIKQFVDLANIEYDPSFGSPEIVLSLRVVGKDWWLERHEYDGSEWWEFKKKPKKLPKIKMASLKEHG